MHLLKQVPPIIAGEQAVGVLDTRCGDSAGADLIAWLTSSERAPVEMAPTSPILPSFRAASPSRRVGRRAATRGPSAIPSSAAAGSASAPSCWSDRRCADVPAPRARGRLAGVVPRLPTAGLVRRRPPGREHHDEVIWIASQRLTQSARRPRSARSTRAVSMSMTPASKSSPAAQRFASS